MAYENYTIRQYMNAQYNGDRSVMSDDVLKTVNLEYIDTAELYEKLEHTKRVYIESLSKRINAITIHIKLQRDFLRDFGKAYLPTLGDFKKYGHSIKWTTKEKFLKDLKTVERSEKMYMTKMEDEIKTLQDIRAKKEQNEVTVNYSRGSFVKLVIGIGKCGYNIDNDKTTMEEFAFMIKQQTDENKKK